MVTGMVDHNFGQSQDGSDWVIVNEEDISVD